MYALDHQPNQTETNAEEEVNTNQTTTHKIESVMWESALKSLKYNETHTHFVYSMCDDLRILYLNAYKMS